MSKGLFPKVCYLEQCSYDILHGGKQKFFGQHKSRKSWLHIWNVSSWEWTVHTGIPKTMKSPKIKKRVQPNIWQIYMATKSSYHLIHISIMQNERFFIYSREKNPRSLLLKLFQETLAFSTAPLGLEMIVVQTLGLGNVASYFNNVRFHLNQGPSWFKK